MQIPLLDGHSESCYKSAPSTVVSVAGRRCIDRRDRKQMFGDMVKTFEVIPNDRRGSRVCLGESVPPCLNVTSSYYSPARKKRMYASCAGNLESVRPPPISGCADFRPKVFKVCKNFRVVLITRRRGPQRRSKKR